MRAIRPPIKIVYLTWGETPRAYGIYRSQVAGMLANVAARHADIAPHLLAGVPVIHSGLVRERWRYPAELRRLRAALGRVPLEICPIPVPQTFVYPRERSFGAIFAGARFFLLPRLRRIDPAVVHCRSFLAAWIATDLRRRAGLGYRIIYDARSLWPEMQYRRRPDADELAAFRARERALVGAVDAVVAVNEPMRAHYAEMGAHRAVTNYIAAPLAEVGADTPRDPGAPLRLVYAGALHEGGMQAPAMLFDLAAAVARLMGEVRLTVLTTSPHGPLRAQAEAVLGPGVATFEAVTDPARMPALLAANDLSCNVYKRPLTDIDRMLCATGLSTKSAEYLAAGVPILVSPYPQAVGHLVSENGVGTVFDETRPDFGLTRGGLEALLAPEMRARARALAAETFDRDIVADRFAALYRDPGGDAGGWL